MEKLNTGLMFWGIALTIELLCQWRERAGSLVAAFLEVERDEWRFREAQGAGPLCRETPPSSAEYSNTAWRVLGFTVYSVAFCITAPLGDGFL